jgi:hypothetical protein
MTKVTYIPADPTSPAVLSWNGIEFPANTPIELDPVRHSYMVPIVDKWVDEKTGEVRSKATEKRISMVEIAKTNPSFQVEGEAPPARKPGRPRTPKTSDEYRNYAQAWIAASEDHDDLAERWNDEEALRERCGVGDDDVSYLRPFFDAKHFELKKRAA